MEILTPAITLGGLGLVFALLLTFAANRFAIHVDEHVQKVREALPGANCGGCGFVGCDAFSEAVAAGEASVNGCPVGGKNTAYAIAAIMGKAPVETTRVIARVICQGTQGNTEEKYDYDGLKDCQGASQFADGYKTCRFACLGFGNCVEVCKFGAIKIEHGLAQIDESKCMGCGRCANICPRRVIQMMPDNLPILLRCRNYDKGKSVRDVCQQGCISCQRCVKQCESEAITFDRNLPVIDYNKCVGCKKCAQVCASHTITDLGERGVKPVVSVGHSADTAV